MALERQAGNFAVAYKNANSEGKPARARDLLKERIKQGIDSDVCYPGAWTTESFSCIQGNIYGCLAEFNPLIPYAQTAVDVHKNNGEFYLTPDVLLNARPATAVILEIAKQDKSKPAYRKRVINLGKIQTHNVPTDSLADDNGILFLARSKNLAKEYGLFLRKKAGIPEIIFYLPPIQSQDYSRGFWLSSIGHGGRSGFSCGIRGLYRDDGSLFRVRGKESAEGAQKISLNKMTSSAD
ncbi:hypothetical protein J4429_04205 [Candidatus Pacearchaeota archaeon]|nr:hypothetical protein [Candidatus Pacearchaeota archaeon]